MKKILILGGTQFIGRNLVERLQENSEYDVTLFNRQQTNSDLFPKLKKIKGDRETNDIAQLKGQHWDGVIDLSCYYPNSLQNLLDTLKGNVKRYIFISTISVYQKETPNLITEDDELYSCDPLQRTDTTMASYGSRKAECERVLQKTEWLDKIILRPSIVYGKYDTTDRFYYWLYKAAKKQSIILPNKGTDIITLTYVNDLVEIIIKAMDVPKHSTVYNATTHSPLSLHSIINSIDETSVIQNVNSDELLKKGIEPGLDIPLWFNRSLLISNERLAKDLGVRMTPFDKSVKETQAWYQSLKWPKPTTGLEEQREKLLMAER